MHTPLSLTVGIPTCYGGETLLATVRSIRASLGVGKFRFVVVADTTPITAHERTELKKLDVELIWNTERGSQAKKIQQLLALANTDIFVFTQDDVRFAPDTLSRMMDAFARNPEYSMITSRVLPEPPETWFARTLAFGARVAYNVSVHWHNGDNYLSANGRCIGFRMHIAKRYVMHPESINNDAYLYLENKRVGGIYYHEPKSVVYNRIPLKFREHLNQTSRFRYSRAEMSSYFTNLDAEYAVPKRLLWQEFIKEFVKDPFYGVFYIAINIYAQIAKKQVQVKNPLWSADVSTKRIKTV